MVAFHMIQFISSHLPAELLRRMIKIDSDTKSEAMVVIVSSYTISVLANSVNASGGSTTIAIDSSELTNLLLAECKARGEPTFKWSIERKNYLFYNLVHMLR